MWTWTFKKWIPSSICILYPQCVWALKNWICILLWNDFDRLDKSVQLVYLTALPLYPLICDFHRPPKTGIFCIKCRLNFFKNHLLYDLHVCGIALHLSTINLSVSFIKKKAGTRWTAINFPKLPANAWIRPRPPLEQFEWFDQFFFFYMPTLLCEAVEWNVIDHRVTCIEAYSYSTMAQLHQNICSLASSVDASYFQRSQVRTISLH